MGAGIAEVLARAGLSVTAVEINDDAVARGRAHVEQSTDRAVSRGKLGPADRDAIFERIRFSTSLEDLANAELVVEALAARLGKVDVTIGDKAGFIANALLFGYLNHAVAMYENRYASREDIDAAMRLGCGLPMGPLALMDLIGIDTAYEILDTMYKQSRNRLHAPSPVIKQMTTAGLLGRKSGRGFYTYADRDSAEVVPDAATPSAEASVEGARPVRTVGVVGSGTMATGFSVVASRRPPATRSSAASPAPPRSTSSPTAT